MRSVCLKCTSIKIYALNSSTNICMKKNIDRMAYKSKMKKMNPSNSKGCRIYVCSQ